MPTHQEIKDQARAMAQSVLSHAPSFRSMERAEQMSLYKDMVNTQYNNLAYQHGLLSEQSGLSTAMAGGEQASDYVNLSAHDPRGLTRAGMKELADGMKSIDFPGFVRDLLVGVFEANLTANERQQEAFVRLVGQLTKSYSDIIKTQINAQDALGRLVQNDPRFKNKRFSAGRPGAAPRRGRPNQQTQPQQGQQTQPQQGQPAGDGLPVLLDDKGKEVKDAALQWSFQNMLLDMAKEYRALLREMLLMGVSRMVVEEGTIRATANFQVKIGADQTLSEYADATVNKDQSSNDFFVGGGFAFGGFAVGGFNRSSTITVQANSDITADSNKAIDSSAEVTGFVELKFKSDYFKLDNFLQIMDLGRGQIAQGPPAKGQPQAPASPTSQPLPAAAPAAPQPDSP